MKKIMGSIALAIVAIYLSGCVSVTPEGLSVDIAPIDLSAARESPDKFRDQRVRLGGEIVSLQSLKDSTVIELVSRSLDRRGRPANSDSTDGRFLATIKGFLDPANYSEGRELTVTGLLSGNKEQKIGEYPYQYPVVTVESHHLWKKLPETSRYDHADFWFYGPWYGYPGHRYGGYHPFWDHPYYW